MTDQNSKAPQLHSESEPHSTPFSQEFTKGSRTVDQRLESGQEGWERHSLKHRAFAPNASQPASKKEGKGSGGEINPLEAIYEFIYQRFGGRTVELRVIKDLHQMQGVSTPKTGDRGAGMRKIPKV